MSSKLSFLNLFSIIFLTIWLKAIRCFPSSPINMPASFVLMVKTGPPSISEHSTWPITVIFSSSSARRADIVLIWFSIYFFRPSSHYRFMHYSKNIHRRPIKSDAGRKLQTDKKYEKGHNIPHLDIHTFSQIIFKSITHILFFDGRYG